MSEYENGDSAERGDLVESNELLELYQQCPELRDCLGKVHDASYSFEDRADMVEAFNQRYMKEKKGMYKIVPVSSKVTAKSYDNGSISISISR